MHLRSLLLPVAALLLLTAAAAEAQAPIHAGELGIGSTIRGKLTSSDPQLDPLRQARYGRRLPRHHYDEYTYRLRAGAGAGDRIVVCLSADFDAVVLEGFYGNGKYWNVNAGGSLSEERGSRQHVHVKVGDSLRAIRVSSYEGGPVSNGKGAGSTYTLTIQAEPPAGSTAPHCDYRPPSPPPRPAPAPAPAAYELDLARHSGWPTGTRGRCTYQYAGGGYRMQGGGECSSPILTYRTGPVVLETVSRVVDGDTTNRRLAAALRFGIEGDTAFYSVTTSTDGNLGLLRSDRLSSGGERSIIYVNRPMAAINQGLYGENRVTVELRGQRATISVNGVKAGTWQLLTVPAPNVMLGNGNASTVVLSRLRIQSLAP